MVIEIIREASIDSLKSVGQIAMIVIPLMIVLRILKEAQILNKISSYLEPLTTKLYLSKEATFPLIVGVTFGITYGAGLILQATKEGSLKENDLLLLNVFLGLNHAIFEDTFLFSAIGANGVILFITRTVLAILTTYLLGRWLSRKVPKNDKEVVLNQSVGE